MENSIKIAICSNATDNSKVVKFIALDKFPPVFQELYNNGEIWGVYYNENQDLVGQRIGDDEPFLIEL